MSSHGRDPRQPTDGADLLVWRSWDGALGYAPDLGVIVALLVRCPVRQPTIFAYPELGGEDRTPSQKENLGSGRGHGRSRADHR